MKLSAYVVRADTGFSPNPFGRCLTLACCKPSIRRCADKNDTVVGMGSAKAGRKGKVIYAMRVRDTVPVEQYWDRYPSKRPNAKTSIGRCGDNIWRCVSGAWVSEPSAFHDQKHHDYDIGGERILVASEFYYFGEKAVDVPPQFQGMLTVARGHRNTSDEQLIQDFWDWLKLQAPNPGRIGMPFDFDGDGCRLHCRDHEENGDEP